MTSAALKDRVAIGQAETEFGRLNIVHNNAAAMHSAAALAGELTQTAEFRQSLARNHLTPYIGEPQDIANVVAFLAGDDSRFVTGHLFSVDGGLSAHQGMYAGLVGDVA